MNQFDSGRMDVKVDCLFNATNYKNDRSVYNIQYNKFTTGFEPTWRCQRASRVHKADGHQLCPYSCPCHDISLRSSELKNLT